MHKSTRGARSGREQPVEERARRRRGSCRTSRRDKRRRGHGAAFPSIAARRVYGIFRTAGYPEAVAHLLTALTTNVIPATAWAALPRPRALPQIVAHHRLGRRLATPHLPQGAPTSPALMTRAGRQRVCGIVVNDRPNVPREYDRLRAILHNAARHGPDAENRAGVPDFRAHLLGRIGWVDSVNPARGSKLRARFALIAWE